MSALFPPRTGHSGRESPPFPDPYGSRFTPGSSGKANRRLRRASTRPRPDFTEWAALGCVLLAAALVRWAWLDFHLDDSYITYTYARSLAQDQGLTFAGVRVLGTTTPLYAVLLSIVMALGLPVTAAAKALGLTCSVGTSALLYLLAREQLGRPAALLAAGLLALNGVHASMSMSGMETGIYTAVCLAAFLCFQRGMFNATAALAAAACLLRPDGVLLAGVLALAHVWVRRPFARASLLWFVAPVAVWLLVATLVYGSPVPTSVSAKLAYPDYGAFKLSTALRSVGPRLGVFVLLLGGWGIAEVHLKARPLSPFVAWTALYLLAFTRAPNFLWYYAPAMPGLILLGVAGLTRVARGIPPPTWRPAWVANTRRLAAVLACTALLLLASADLSEHRDFVARTHGPDVTGAYRSMGVWLQRNTPAEAVVATPEVGYIGYFSRRRILDLAGLCSPEVIPYLKRRAYADVVHDFQPDFVALTTEGGRPLHRAILESPWFAEHYHERIRFPYRGAAYVIYGRTARSQTPVKKSGR
ncbi:MAG: hypothetical protein ACO1SX_23315 [Actinomycetota bacterium]